MRLLLALLGLALLWPFAHAFAAVVATAASAAGPELTVGVVLGFVLDEWLRTAAPAIEVAEHEATHAMMALLWLRPIRGFRVTAREGGYVTYGTGFGGKLGDHVIGLAPYFVPTLTLLSLLARPVVPAEWLLLFRGWIGLTLGYHCWSSLRELRDNWGSMLRLFRAPVTDLEQNGHFSSLPVIFCGTFALYGLCLAILLGGSAGVLSWAHAAVAGVRSELVLGANLTGIRLPPAVVSALGG